MISKTWRWIVYKPFLYVTLYATAFTALPSSEMNLRPFLNWVYDRQPSVYATLSECSDETLQAYSKKLAQHIICSQSIQASSDVHSTTRKAQYQRVLFHMLKEDQLKQQSKKIESAEPSKVQSELEKMDVPITETLPTLPSTSTSTYALRAFLLQAESEDRKISRKLREHRLLHADPHSAETIKALTEAVYDEILHRIYLFTQYAESLCFHDNCVQKIQTILSSDMDNLIKVKQIFPLLQMLENSNIKYAAHVYANHGEEDQWIREHIKLPGAHLDYPFATPERAEIIHKILNVYPSSQEAQRVYQKLCVAFLAQIMGEISIDNQHSNSLLVLMMDAATDLYQTWDIEQFKHLLMHWPNTSPNHEILQKHLEKLGRILPVALRHTQEWPAITTSCDAEYKKIMQIVAGVISQP